ncbi:unnamed protein product [Peronospora farinosa]|uniref:Uncharacterized protein n=1 Tax=Peronospora farinosa TaxID=134698 RepID=A0AAV0UJD6_9STRA|nr:unnamed protein product [Peronospora farinosa]CAI5734889.1 unnamed protein product [Peronospora farinosa]
MVSGTDEGVFLVDDAIFSAHEVHLMTQKEQASTIQLRSMDEILYIASIIAQHQFTVDVVNSILEFAGVLLTFQFETSEFRCGHSNMNEDCLQLQLPTVEQLEIPPRVDVTKFRCFSLLVLF